MRRVSLVSLLCLLAAAACSNPGREREKQGITPTYDRATGKLKELTYDSNHDGKIDTWTEMDGARPVLTRIDRNGDGKIDRWEYYDEAGKLVKVGFSRKDNGKPDAWAYGSSDRLERVEVSSTGDEHKIDRWEHYANGVIVSAEEDTNSDGAPDKWETFENGEVNTISMDENHDGRPDRRLTYVAGTLISIETAPDASGNYTRKTGVRH
jgi:hypothetical protein